MKRNAKGKQDAGKAKTESNRALKRQLQVYQAGFRGEFPEIPVSLEELEKQAKKVMDSKAFAYVAGGAGAGKTMQANREAFRRWQILPRMLRNVEGRDLSVRLLGVELPVPVLLAPVGALSIVEAEAELAVAGAAKSLGVSIILSAGSSKTLEVVASTMGEGLRWFQLYWGRDRDLTLSFLSRAAKAGYSAVVVTVDAPVLGWREQELQAGYLPFLTGQGLANYFSDPVFRKSLGRPPEENLPEAIHHVLENFSDPTFTWKDLVFLRSHTELPILLKGILHLADAEKAVDHAVDGIIVSNHGGRQVDGAVGALDVLPEVVAAVKGRVPVLFDSGIRCGADAFVAIALGAQAVLLGRPYVYGLALGGRKGVEEVLLNFLADLELTLALSGYRSFEEVNTSALRSNPD